MSTSASEQINARLREEFPAGASFDGLRDRLERGLREALEDGEDSVCVKVPSFWEIEFPVALVRAALAEAR